MLYLYYQITNKGGVNMGFNIDATLERFLEIYPDVEYLQLIYGKQIVKIDLKVEYSFNLTYLFLKERFILYNYNEDKKILILKYYV